MQNVADYLNTELKALFPNSGVNAVVRTILGGDTISIYYINAASSKDCVFGIAMNDPAYMHISIDSDESCAEMLVKNDRNIKFRKINGKNSMEIARKVIAWFAKNREAILAIKK